MANRQRGDGRINTSVGMRVHPEVMKQLRDLASEQGCSVATFMGQVAERLVREEKTKEARA